VTLEPCNHHGRTPPCTEALVRAGVARVVFAVADPNPHVAGGGRLALTSAGVDVCEGFLEPVQREAARVLAPWLTFITAGRTHVTLKVAMSLDGRIATRTGESRWITGLDARRDVHALRARCDAVLVGSRTVLADDPELTVRHVPTGRQPARVVIDSALVTPVASKLAQTAREVPVWVLTRRGHAEARVEALRSLGVEVVALEALDGRVDLLAALRWLAERGVVSALCEGGGALHGAFLDRRLGERVVAYVAPMVLGGAAAPAAFGGLGVGALGDARRLRDLRVERLGDDLRIEGEF
jgi:diaminohydroxyphosphoribosylaminopyrimidine deaminase / 5-amino-6-(5-phosphoribosylamino)uracil reductase